MARRSSEPSARVPCGRLIVRAGGCAVTTTGAPMNSGASPDDGGPRDTGSRPSSK